MKLEIVSDNKIFSGSGKNFYRKGRYCRSTSTNRAQVNNYLFRKIRAAGNGYYCLPISKGYIDKVTGLYLGCDLIKIIRPLDGGQIIRIAFIGPMCRGITCAGLTAYWTEIFIYKCYYLL